MLKKNLSNILIALATILLIAIVISVFNRRIKNIEKKTQNSILLKQK